MIPSAVKPEINIELTERQAEVLNSKCTEILYGGAAGGGKSFLARCLAILWCLEIPGINIFLFRRIYADLQLNHLQGPRGFLAMLAPLCNTKHPQSDLIGGVLCDIVDGEIRFWNGSRIFLCHLQHQKDLTKYYGPEFHVLMIEEATQFSEYMIRFLRSRLRIPKALKIPDKYKKPKEEWRVPTEPDYYFPRVLMTSNPGGVGHSYIKKAFVSCAPPGIPHRAPDDDGGHTRVYIPAKVDDNPFINREEVKANLAGLPPQLVAALLDGNWNAIMGAFFPEIDRSIHVIKSFQIPSSWTRLMAMDWGAAGEGDPFSCGWAAVSDGSFPEYPRGSIIFYRRWTGHGLPKTTASAVAEGIISRERHDGQIAMRVAGGDIMEKRGHGPSIFEIFASAGVHFSRADNRRASGWMQIRERLVGKNGVPAVYWFEEAAGDLDTMGNLQHDLNDTSDCAPGDDHCADRVRYLLMARPWVREAPSASKTFAEQFRPPTLNESWEILGKKKR